VLTRLVVHVRICAETVLHILAKERDFDGLGRIRKHVSVVFDRWSFWPPDPVEKEAAVELLELLDQNHIPAQKTQAVDEEISQAPAHVKKVVDRLAYLTSYDMFATAEERGRLQEIRKMLFGARSNLGTGDVNDARNLLCSAKHGYTS
jgi:hypothetical protein